MNKYFPVVEGATLSIGASRDLLFRTIRTRPESKFIFEISEKTYKVINELRYRGDLVTLCHGDRDISETQFDQKKNLEPIIFGKWLTKL